MPASPRPLAPAAPRPRLRALALALALVGGAAACRGGSPDAPARRNASERPPPFATAPEFSLVDAAGATQRLDALMGAKGLVLVLYRGHW
jgi:hypothetical protein